MKKIFFSALLVLCLLCGVSAPAFAQEVPDKSRKGSITIAMQYNGAAVAGGTITAYRVGDICETDGNYSFAKTAAMQGFDGSYQDISSADLAQAAAAFVTQNNVPAYAVAHNENGQAAFRDMELGLYLLVQTEASDGYEPLHPFMVTVPMNENGRYQYEINAAGKFQLTPKQRPALPDKPQEPQLPQTGQLNWPVPLLAILGLCLFAVGWRFYFGGEKE